MPHAAVTTIMALQKSRVRVPVLNTRRYWKSSASFMKVEEIG
jgi:hypothetical protein